MAIQSQLSIKTRKTKGFKPKTEPSHLLDWACMKPGLKRYILLQVIQGIVGHPQRFISIDELSSNINRNTAIKSQNRAGIVKDQLKIYIENLIYYGFLDDSYSKGLLLNDSIYDELQSVEKIISEDGGGVER